MAKLTGDGETAPIAVTAGVYQTSVKVNDHGDTRKWTVIVEQDVAGTGYKPIAQYHGAADQAMNLCDSNIKFILNGSAGSPDIDVNILPAG